jgi:hypothetical protein
VGFGCLFCTRAYGRRKLHDLVRQFGFRYPSVDHLTEYLSNQVPESARPVDQTSFEDGASVFGRAHRAGIQLGGTSQGSGGFSCVWPFIIPFPNVPAKVLENFRASVGKCRRSGGSAFETGRVITRRVIGL